jgi:DNA repair exonuclease SbcCD ATPase subunit
MTKKVIFDKLSIKNFLSVGNEAVVINFKTGINIITGINKDQLDRRNGIGKSTITDALSFVLFGHTLRDLKKEFIVNNITNKTAEVSLIFRLIEGANIKKYELYRSIDPSKFILYEDDIDVTRDSMVNTTDFLRTVLNITPEIFQNCLVMAINNTIPFMAKKKIEKRKFIESIFNLEVFSRMNSSLKDEYNEVKRSFDINVGKYEEVNSIKNKIKANKDSQIKEENEHRGRLSKRKNDFIKEREELQKKVDGIKEIDIKEVKAKIIELTEKEKQIAEEISAKYKKIASLETKIEYSLASYSKIGTEEDICPVCLRGIDNDNKAHTHKKKKEIKKEMEVVNISVKEEEEELNKLSLKRQKIQDGIKSLEGIISKKKLQDQNKEHFKQSIKNLDSQIKNIEQDFENVKQVDSSLDNILLESENKIKELEGDIGKQRDLIGTLDTVKFVISEEGVKSFIVKKILRLFNSKLGYYLRRLNSTAIITFNEYFEETIVNEKGKLTCYDNYSGAEKKIIDLAIMFTFLDMLRLQGNVLYTLQIYDELLDTSLDETGVEMVLSLLNEFTNSNELGIYIISHRKECSKISSNDLVYLEKVGGITRRVNYSVE